MCLLIVATLDEPEAFLLEMTKMSQFTERIECLAFRKSFNESLFDIGNALSNLVVRNGLINNVKIKQHNTSIFLHMEANFLYKKAKFLSYLFYIST